MGGPKVTILAPSWGLSACKHLRMMEGSGVFRWSFRGIEGCERQLRVVLEGHPPPQPLTQSLYNLSPQPAPQSPKKYK